MSGKQVKVAVSMRALIARINRKLAKNGQALRTSRSAAEVSNLGNYHVVDTYRNTVVVYPINDIQKWVREEFPGMLKPFETLDA